MKATAPEILSVLDAACDSFTFPMLDNGYVYLAATRLTLFRSPADWALTIEVFGFSPRAGLPDTFIYTFATERNESRVIHPIEDGDWLDGELVSQTATEVVVRAEPVALPSTEELERAGIELETEDEIQVFELCRYLANIRRAQVLASPEELRLSVGPQFQPILQLDEWHHPDVVDEACRPSGSQTFQQLAAVLVTGDISLYRPELSPNTHWANWPDGGTL